jgi:hypothetical protein
MMHRACLPIRQVALVLALLSCAAGQAVAAGPMGAAVAGAPSLFVLAVAEVTEKDEKTAAAKPRPQEPTSQQDAARPDRSKQTAARSEPQERPDTDVSALQRVSLR